MKAYFLVNGIRVVPGSEKNWNGKGQTWINVQFADDPVKAEKVEYYCDAFSRAFGQKNRANKLFRTMSYYDNPENYRVVVGHSNGADVAITMMRDHPSFPRIHELHLVCGATNANFHRNGLNRMLQIGRVGKVFVYVAGKDQALRLASWRLARLLGYGTLGLHGARGVAHDVADRVKTIKAGWENYGHSTCWDDDHFEQTMLEIVRA